MTYTTRTQQLIRELQSKMAVPANFHAYSAHVDRTEKALLAAQKALAHRASHSPDDMRAIRETDRLCAEAADLIEQALRE